MGADFKDAPDSVAGAVGFVDYGLEADLGFGVYAAEEDFLFLAEFFDFFPGGFVGHGLGAYADDVAQDFDTEFCEVGFGECAYGDAGGGFTGARAFEDVAGVVEIVLDAADQVCVAGAWALYFFEFFRRAFVVFDWHGLGPVLPVFVGYDHCDGGTDGDGVSDARNNVGCVCFNLHAATTAEALLATPQFMIDFFEGYGDARGEAGNCGYQTLAVAFARSFKAEHLV